ncbi:hypothetical protein ACN28E_18495 [Archangium lansingense]|uniref:hypothetical protein n=1 Tax=Archangium lansingense TaxID=2995310 RepID=UPI003B7EBD16
MTDFKKQGRSDSKPATSSPSTSGAGISRSTERPRTSPLKRPISVEDVMREVDMPAELQRTRHTSIARFEQQRLSSAEPHLLQSTHVNKKPRREAQVKTSSDRLSLAAESKVQGDNHYTQLTQALQEGQQPSIVGRFQDPTQKKAAIDERFIYQRGKSTPPSYPEKARDLERMKTNHDLTDAQVAKEVKNAMRVSPLQYGTKEQQGSVATIANLIGISEQRRDPYMAFTSAQRIDYASAPQHSESPTTLFGKKKGKTNLAGTLPASGTGAKASIQEGQRVAGVWSGSPK